MSGSSVSGRDNTGSITPDGVLDPVTIASCGIRPDSRAEQVSVEGFLKLAAALV